MSTDIKDPSDIKSMTTLIHEWLNEDRFLAKYTKRQKAVLCKKLTQKLHAYKDQRLERALEEAKEANQEVEAKLVRYRKAYQILLRKAYTTRWFDRICQVLWVIWMTMVIRSIAQAFIASIPQGWCSATALPQTETYKTIAPP